MKPLTLLIALNFLFAMPIAADEVENCDARAQSDAAIKYVSSRYCGTPFDDAKVVYVSNGVRDLMSELRSPVVPGHFRLNSDSMILADRISLVEKEYTSAGSRFVFRYRRLATMEGSANFRVFISDPNSADRFQITVNENCLIVDPPVARVHPSRLYNELKESYESVKRSLGGNCELPHCLVLKQQIDSLSSNWGREIKDSCASIAIKETAEQSVKSHVSY